MGELLKEGAFALLILLVSISAIHDFSQSNPALQKWIGVKTSDDFKAKTLINDLQNILNAFESFITGTPVVTTTPLADVPLLGALISFLYSVWNIFVKLAFGWVGLLNIIFSEIGLEYLQVVFAAPIATVEIIAGLYFMRDFVNTVRGAG